MLSLGLHLLVVACKWQQESTLHTVFSEKTVQTVSVQLQQPSPSAVVEPIPRVQPQARVASASHAVVAKKEMREPETKTETEHPESNEGADALELVESDDQATSLAEVQGVDEPSFQPATGNEIPDEFTKALLQHLARHKEYPYRARLAGMQGVGKVSFAIDCTGKLRQMALEESTRSADLDRAIHQMFDKAFPLPHSIARLGPERGAAFTLPVAFALN